MALSGFGDALLSNHLRAISEMVARDKNRASVVMWSVANEPRSAVPQAEPYFRKVVQHTKQMDPTRPVTCVVSASAETDQASKSVDIIGVNRYYSWYTDTGHTELITQQWINELHLWHKLRQKPIIVTEYGADTIAGLHKV